MRPESRGRFVGVEVCMVLDWCAIYRGLVFELVPCLVLTPCEFQGQLGAIPWFCGGDMNFN